MKALSPRQHRFALEYLQSGNLTQAALKAGYSLTYADRQGKVLLGSPVVRTFLAEKLAHAELTAERTLEELRRVAFFDIRELFDDEGHLVPVKTLPAEVATAIESVEVVRTNLVSGDHQREWLHKVKASSKMAALELLAKHFRLVDEHVNVSGTVALIALLEAGRLRNAEAKALREKNG